MKEKIPDISDSQIKKGIYVRPRLWDPIMEQKSNSREKADREYFKNVNKNCFDYNNTENQKSLINEILTTYRAQGSDMSIKTLFFCGFSFVLFPQLGISQSGPAFKNRVQ